MQINRPNRLFCGTCWGRQINNTLFKRTPNANRFSPCPPFVIKEASLELLELKAHVESDETGGERYCFRHCYKYCYIIPFPMGRGRDANGYRCCWYRCCWYRRRWCRCCCCWYCDCYWSALEQPLEQFGRYLLQKKRREQTHTAK